MVSQYKAIIKDFDYQYFVSAFAFKHGLNSLRFSQQKGIISPDFITDCHRALARFNQNYDYSKANVEKFFKVKFCHLRIEKGKIQRFQDTPAYGSNIIYINKRLFYSDCISNTYSIFQKINYVILEVIKIGRIQL